MSEPRLRWRLVEEEDAGQQTLFDEPSGWHAGRGEFRALEFLHVRAKRIINEVPAASRMPFRYTINAYRGCSHACTYCLAGDTVVLMGDGRDRALSDVRPGDTVYGTVGAGANRRYTVTPVLDHWSTVKPAYRVVLADGTVLVASADHRFLTDQGWAHVAVEERGRNRRPFLTTTSLLHGTGRRGLGPNAGAADAAVRPQPGMEGVPVTGNAELRVVSVEPLGTDVPMYDMTTGTGDFVANGVVSHNCFARPTHEYLNLNSGEDFERRIVVKINAVERARAEVASPRWAGESIAMGTNTDPYQRCEGKYRLTRGIVEVLGAARNPFSILTKSTLILRDLDVLADAARRTDVRAALSIGTLDEEVWRATEPGSPHPLRRVEAVARLNEAGIPTSVLVAPILPGLSDAPDQLEAVVQACRAAGARSITPIVLHLRPGVRDHYMAWLGENRPELAERYGSLYLRAYAPKAYQAAIAAIVHDASGEDTGRAGRALQQKAANVPEGG